MAEQGPFKPCLHRFESDTVHDMMIMAEWSKAAGGHDQKQLRQGAPGWSSDKDRHRMVGKPSRVRIPLVIMSRSGYDERACGKAPGGPFRSDEKA